MNPIDKALEIAIRVHTGQVDKAGKPYILHPLRMMNRMQTENEKVVAILHDVLEDSNLSQPELSTYGFNDDVVKALVALTKGTGEEYEAYIQRVKSFL